jgi:hypothetical protein
MNWRQTTRPTELEDFFAWLRLRKLSEEPLELKALTEEPVSFVTTGIKLGPRTLTGQWAVREIWQAGERYALSCKIAQDGQVQLSVNAVRMLVRRHKEIRRIYRTSRIVFYSVSDILAILRFNRRKRDVTLQKRITPSDQRRRRGLRVRIEDAWLGTDNQRGETT